MKQEEKLLAESILRHLCIGRRICGVNFVAMPYLLIFDGPIKEYSLLVESEWRVYDEVPAELPIIQFPNDIVDQQRTSELICTIGKLGWYPIGDIKLGDNIPHLLITFENGQTLFINGHHSQYESWEFYAKDFHVVATPEDGLAIWHPHGFKADK